MTRVYIVRHAEAEGNLYRRIHGWYDSRVTENGRRQIAALEQRFQDIHVDAAYASDLRRTQITAQAVVRPKGLELRIDPGLREIGMGVLEDHTFGDLLFHDPVGKERFFTCSPDWTCEGGETFAQVADRLHATLLRLAAAHPDQTVALFTHSTAIRCLLSAIRGKHPAHTPELGHCENTGVSCLEIEDGQVRIVFENDASHLPAEIATAARDKAAASRGSIYQTWFRPLDLETEGELYLAARRDAWELVYDSTQDFDGAGFLREARAQQAWGGPRALECVMLQDKVIGVLQMDFGRHADEGVGYLPLVYLAPEYRRLGIGVQLIGEAVCLYRSMGRRCLRLRCAVTNEPAQRFYHKFGFQPVGQSRGSRSGALLDILEFDIATY